jgi:protein gp37
MNKTKIEWCDYTVNPVKGICPMACPYCYARRMYKRFGWNPEIKYAPEAYYGLSNIKQPSRIFVGSTMELFGDWVDEYFMKHMFNVVRQVPQLTFIFLTKQPQNLAKWSPFPDNCWVGVSVTNTRMYQDAAYWLRETKAKVKFVSFEPLLEEIVPVAWPWRLSFQEKELWGESGGINWVIVGQQTPSSPKTNPDIKWVKGIVQAADKAGVPVFLKGNLRDLLVPKALMDDIFWESEKAKLRQEFPKVLVTK